VGLEALDLLLEVEVGEHLGRVLGVAVDVGAQVGGDVPRIVGELVEAQRRLVEERALGHGPQQQLGVFVAGGAAPGRLGDHRIARVLHRLVQPAHQREGQDHVPVL